MVTSASFAPGEYELTSDAPLRIGSGELDSFAGKIRLVQAYSRTLGEQEIQRVCQSGLAE